MAGAQNVQTIVLSRHFEKVDADTDGKAFADPALTARGQQQALALASLLEPLSIERIFSTDYLRTRQSAAPTAKSLGLPVEIYDPRQPESLVEQLRTDQQNSLILGHSNTIPALVEKLGGSAMLLAEKDYGVVFIIKIDWDVSGDTPSKTSVVSSLEQLTVD
ncbi:SixA phosphatase family protein [Alteromonas oceanisediminis]|uniref:SixA phosphatase family protein n=1 Tax=Alteromonas oceanisediminis TaxID=2836180 RepID=UPI001BD96B87|nr:histidine phosphatase family protein [Alteromonas oceanisediminis]MBT0587698.1 histidine phosphatase family protein [Alteromonas oceanisediminis]